MEWLNYHHLFYFWRIAREGGLSRAAEQLRLTHSTLSAQLKALEEFFGGPLFERRGRRLVLTPLGENAASYADDIFRMGSELVDVARGSSSQRQIALRVGIVSSLPKSVAYRLLQPGLATPGYGSLVARQDRFERLLDELSAGRLHLVLSDAAAPESGAHRAYAHVLGESPILLYGTRALAAKYRPRFPQSLNGAPLLLPTAQTSLRTRLDRWLGEREIRAQVVGEFDDPSLMRIAGANGLGLLPVRAALRAEVEDGFSLVPVGTFDDVVERYYVVSTERRVHHPAVSAILEQARVDLANDGAEKQNGKKAVSSKARPARAPARARPKSRKTAR